MRQGEARGSLPPVHELLLVKKVIQGWPREWQGAGGGETTSSGATPITLTLLPVRTAAASPCEKLNAHLPQEPPPGLILPSVLWATRARVGHAHSTGIPRRPLSALQFVQEKLSYHGSLEF